MNKLIISILYIVMFIIGATVMSIGILGILPDSMLTELGKNNRSMIASSFHLSLLILFCGTYTAFKGLQKL